MLTETFSTKVAASSPLTFNYPITAQVSIETRVFGDARNNATVSIMSGSITVWSGTMTQTSPEVTIPDNLQVGIVKFLSGKFFLTVPTTLQNGNVRLAAEIQQNNDSYPFNAIVATWPLSSTDAAKDS